MTGTLRSRRALSAPAGGCVGGARSIKYCEAEPVAGCLDPFADYRRVLWGFVLTRDDGTKVWVHPLLSGPLLWSERYPGHRAAAFAAAGRAQAEKITALYEHPAKIKEELRLAREAVVAEGDEEPASRSEEWLPEGSVTVAGAAASGKA